MRSDCIGALVFGFGCLFIINNCIFNVFKAIFVGLLLLADLNVLSFPLFSDL